MFAVITLGIGLIMLAAIFPVAIQQTRLSTEETSAAAISRVGMSAMIELGNVGTGIATLLPPTGTVSPNYPGEVSVLSTTAWNAIRGNLVLTADPRYAWVPLYRRDGSALAAPSTWSSVSQVFVIPVKVRNASLFTFPTTAAPLVGDAMTLTPPGSAPFNVPNLMPRAVKVVINDSNPDTITFSASGADATGAVADGTYVIIAKDNIATPAGNVGRMNGRIYRVGTYTGTGNTWYLMPGYDFNPDGGFDGAIDGSNDITGIGTSAPADAFIIGRGFDPSSSPISSFAGPSMDLAAYTGFIYTK